MKVIASVFSSFRQKSDKTKWLTVYFIFFFLLTAVFFFGWTYRFLTPVSFAYQGDNTPIGIFERDGDTFSQKFNVKADSLCGIKVLMATWARVNHHNIIFTLEDESGKIIRQKVVKAEKIGDNDDFRWKFPKIENARGKTFKLILTGQGGCSPSNSITLWTCRSSQLPSAEVNGGKRGMSFRMSLETEKWSIAQENIRGFFLAFISIFLIYSLTAFLCLKKVEYRSWRKWSYGLVFMAGYALLMLRCMPLIAYPCLFTEDAVWSGFLRNNGFFHTLFHSRLDYFVLGNLLFLALARIINSVFWGESLLYFPLVIISLQLLFYTAVAFLPVVVFRKQMSLPGRLLLFLALLLFSASENFCNFEIFGKISNIGYLFCFFQFCLLADLFLNRDHLSLSKIACYGILSMISVATNPVCNIIIFVFFLLECYMVLPAFLQQKSTIFSQKNFWTVGIYGFCALILLIVQMKIMPAFGQKPEWLIQRNSYSWAGIVEAVARAFYPFFSLFYTHLNTFTAVCCISLVLFFILWGLKTAGKNRRLLLLMGALCGGIYLLVLIMNRPIMDWVNDYHSTFLMRYSYGIIFFFSFSVFFAGDIIFSSPGRWKKVIVSICIVFMCLSHVGSRYIKHFLIRPIQPSFFYYTAFLHNTLLPDSQKVNSVSTFPINDFSWKMPVSFRDLQRIRAVIEADPEKFGVENQDKVFFMETSEWKNCISKIYPRFYVRNTEKNRERFHPGGKMVLPSGEKRDILQVNADRQFLTVYVSGEKFPTDKIIPFETFATVPPPVFSHGQLLVTDGNWDSGIHRIKAAFLCRNTLRNQALFCLGNTVILGNFEKRKILRTWQNGVYLEVFLEGLPIKKEIVGSPMNFKVVQKQIEQDVL